MPGIVVFKRRWSVGSDDFVVPAIILLMLHTAWLIVLTVILATVDFSQNSACLNDLYEHVLGYVVILSGCVLVEAFISWVSMRGTILVTAPRTSMQYLLYVRLGILLVEVAWLIVGVVWLGRHYNTCPIGFAKRAILGIIVCNWCVLASVLVTTWCTFDAAGRSWVKMKRYQRSLREGKVKFRYKRSGSSHRNWRHRKAMREYQDSWNRRCRLLFCCMGHSDHQRQNNFADIAKMLSDFFRDLDVVPSDVIAGLVLLRRLQRFERQAILDDSQEDEPYQFLSGVPITSTTKFLDITHPDISEEILTITHYFHYALAVYGWPMYMMIHSRAGCCQLCPYVRCYCLSGGEKKYDAVNIVDDNCCFCNYAALRRLCRGHHMEIVFATYHVAIGETPFFVALDHEKRTVVISVRGTLSLQDVVTDLNAEADQLPTKPRHEDWLGHKGMIQAAEYIKRKLVEESILFQAFNFCPEKGTQCYNLVLVGHSLGAGTAAILAILLKCDYPNLVCYAYSPPGGLLSMPAVEYTKKFITSVVLGKDVVPRIGLHQMEALRSDLINAIKRSQDPKWKIIMGGVLCCCPEDIQFEVSVDKPPFRDVSSHPSDSSIALTVHQPLYPPGRIIHIVRNHPKKEDGKKVVFQSMRMLETTFYCNFKNDEKKLKIIFDLYLYYASQKYETKWRKIFKKNDPVYQALWAENTDFHEVLISPVMVQDHMPDNVLDALEKLLVNTGPTKPQRKLSETEWRQLISSNSEVDIGATTHRIVLETSFTDLQPEKEENHSSAEKKEDEWTTRAPMASPETLSDISSISSKGSHQKLNNGSKLPWAGIPVMEPIAQSPAVQRPTSYTIDSNTIISISLDSGNITNEVEDNATPLFTHKVITEVTVEYDCEPQSRAESPLHDLFKTSSIIEEQTSISEKNCGLDNIGSISASASNESTENILTAHDTKRVTFDLYENQKIAREVSDDSMYNSGESFIPTYPEYSTQQEYGNHDYMYTHSGYPNFSPTASPIIEHSLSDVQLLKLVERPQLREDKYIRELQLREMTPVHEEPIISSSPIERNVVVDGEVLSSTSQRNLCKNLRSESSL